MPAKRWSTITTAIGSPISSQRSCSSDSACSRRPCVGPAPQIRRSTSARNAYTPKCSSQREGLSTAPPPVRGYGTRLLEKYNARPASSTTTFTQLGSSGDPGPSFGPSSANGAARVPMRHAPAHSSIRSINPSSTASLISGSSPWTLMTRSLSDRSSAAVTSPTRSVPLGWSVRVNRASPPEDSTACTIRSSSLATITRSIFSQDATRSNTC